MQVLAGKILLQAIVILIFLCQCIILFEISLIQINICTLKSFEEESRRTFSNYITGMGESLCGMYVVS